MTRLRNLQNRTRRKTKEKMMMKVWSKLPSHEEKKKNRKFTRTWERAKLAATLDHVGSYIGSCWQLHWIAIQCLVSPQRNVSYSLLFVLGAERCNEAVQKLGKKYDIVVNIQGDEPLIEPEIIDGIVKALQRTWERAKLAATLDHVVVATDDERIADCCRQFGADVIMTAESCRNGAERCNEAVQKLRKKYDIVVNIQGDEPLIEPEIIDGIVQALQAAPDAVFSTAVTSLKPEDANDPNRVKCVVDNRGYAIYFSRGLIPFNKSGKVNQQFPYLLHLGIQSYDAKFLKIYSDLQPTPLQLEEDLEQLKVLENGYKMKVIKVDHDAHGVDTPEDVEKLESLMRERNLS
ncbi:3-deoxy-manno-octulosonate cytidylyltransferase, mitochondrial isoform X1 [Lotus japonicus]|uniref:3-deoxy-manno-octulosonate cytidylyltransferase, mitochondrial isoform X1 n=1 Tax=Lotus japonicus TaxID=34305 RepID=UPI0025902AFB|nr:3-deoxy-manno-octulosonate cytidylyltransferase, mitochondrial isoform X1 [Lotus japonicus]